jgi:hypothetical protein
VVLRKGGLKNLPFLFFFIFMDMRNIVKKILLEFAQEVESGLSKFEVLILTRLNKQGFTPKTKRSDILNYLADDLGLDSDESMKFYFLFINNFDKSGNYENITEPVRSTYDKSKQIKTTNVTASDLVKHRVPFKGSNVTGELIGDVYVVTSYGWYPIFVFKDGKWYENSKKYSRTTGKQMGQIRPRGVEITPLTKDELTSLIRN